MRRRSLMGLLLAVLILGLVTPVSIRADTPLIPVVLIHGHGGSADLTWRTAAVYLESRGYRADQSLFSVELPEERTWQQFGLLADTEFVLAYLHDVLEQTGSTRVDLVGHSRGGLVARLLASGSTGHLVRRVVTMNTPHGGALSELELVSMLQAAGIGKGWLPSIQVPVDLQAGSDALRTLVARERRFADQPADALLIAATWQKGVPLVLAGHDGAVSLRSQLGWRGARSRLFRLGPSSGEIGQMLRSDLAAGMLVWRSPHLQSHESEAVLVAVADFLLESRSEAPLRSCDPNCQDWRDLTGHPAEAELRPWLEDLLPYAVADNGRRLFEPDRPMTRAELYYGVARGLGLYERLRRPSFPDTVGHWSFGWVEAALDAKLVEPAGLFRPDAPVTRAEAAALVAAARGLPAGTTPGRFTDTLGHRHEASVEALAALGWVTGEGDRFRPDEPLTMAEGAILLVRGFGR